MSDARKHPVSRRRFIQGDTAATAGSLIRAAQPERPNLLWLVREDTGPHLGCCGDGYSVTPNFDRLAKRGCVYNNCWSSSPVCAPARTAIITGLCPTSTGAEHMRSITTLLAGFKMFPGYLRAAGYYCVNNGKEDYNLEKPPGTWDISIDSASERSAGRGAARGGARGAAPNRATGGCATPASHFWRFSMTWPLMKVSFFKVPRIPTWSTIPQRPG